MDTHLSEPATTHPSNPLLSKQLHEDPRYRTPRLCGSCWKIFERFSYIDMGETPWQQHPDACGCKEHGTGSIHDRNVLWRVHHASNTSFSEAVESGCILCTTVLGYFSRRLGVSEEAWESTLRALSTCYGIVMNPYTSYGMILYINASADVDPRFSSMPFRCEIYKDYNYEPKLDLALASLHTNDTGSMACANLARHWLNDCLAHHEGCPKPPETSWYPTRLLRLDEHVATLVDTTSEFGPYATLSYCWGTAPFPVLREATIKDFNIGVAIEEFLPTFRDAMITVKRLGLTYLWIDCYCIVQDTMDWEIEVSHMRKVYENGVLNIGAAFARGPKEGCFTARDVSTFQSWGLRWQPTELEQEDTFILVNNYGRSTELKPKYVHWQREPLYSRAWVVQERLLCPRMLHFGSSQIRWECRSQNVLNEMLPKLTGKYSEYDPPFGHWNMTGILPGRLAPALWDHLPREEKIWRAVKLWGDALPGFTGARLTFSSDKLPAIQGVADFLAHQLNCRYADGFFELFLPRALCWTQARSPTARISDNSPTWSWTAWNIRISSHAILSDMWWGGGAIPQLTYEPGVMLATCLLDLRRESHLQSSLFCIGKLLLLRCHLSHIFVDDVDFGNGRFGSMGTGCIRLDPATTIRTQALFFPIDVDRTSFLRESESDSGGPGKVWREYKNSDSRKFVYGLLLDRVRDCVFRRIGVCEVTLDENHRSNPLTTKQFYTKYNEARAQLIWLI